MATYRHGLRRGLPRVAGGEPWPPAGDAPAALAPAAAPQPTSAPEPAAPAPAASAPVAKVAPVVSSAGAVVQSEPPAPVAAEPAPSAPAPSAPAATIAPTAATTPAVLRRGLPRTAGGDPWPPSDAVGPAIAAAVAPAVVDADGPATDTVAAPVAAAPQPTGETAPSVAPAPAPAGALRRGLPRIPGGEPWPSADAVGTAPATASAGAAPVQTEVAPTAAAAEEPVPTSVAPAQLTAATSAGVTFEDGPELRRGLPRVVGGEPWPPAGAVARRAVAAVPVAEPPAVEQSAQAAPVEAPVVEPAAAADVAEPAAVAPAARPAAAASAAKEPAPAQPKAKPEPAAKPEPKRFGRFTLKQWIGVGVVGVVGLTALAAGAVFFVRWLLTTEPLVDFMASYPGEYHLPEGAPVGFPGWLGWQHFFNAFLMILIIRSGLQVRREQRPPAYWTPKKNPSGKVSLTVWFHQSLDVLWLVNGVVFIVLLFVTGQWMRVIPTSWEVFPNALSAMLQYISLDWPTDNGWVNYNGLQQLAYFTTIFIAAPLAAATGYRMSGMWPKNAKGLNKAYPVEWARALHFPVMLYFVVFILIHVILVFTTGALRNLNHMYAAQGSTDPTAYADNWFGFWMFVASLVVIAAAWVAARPMVLAPIARLFGTVSSR